METPKQQAIKAAYGEHWAGLSNEKQKYALENEGWIKVAPSQYQMDMFSRLKINKNTHSVRPKSLSGIRYNRGWTRIESEEDMPKDDYFGDLFEVGFLDESGFFHHDKKRCSFKSLKWMYEKKLITHYQLVEKPKPPIF